MTTASEVEYRLWAAQLVLAYLDAVPHAGSAVILELTDREPRTAGPRRLRGTLEALRQIEGDLIAVAVAFDPQTRWPPAEQVTGALDVVLQTTPLHVRSQTVGVLEELAEHVTSDPPDPVSRARPYPWREGAPVTVPDLHAAVATVVWISRQEAVHAGSVSVFRADLISQIARLRAALTGAPAPETVTVADVPDEQALALLATAFGPDNDDFFDIPADSSTWSVHQLDLVSAAKQWIVEHDGAPLSPEQMPQLQNRLARIVCGVTQMSVPSPAEEHEAILAITTRLSDQDMAQLQGLAIRLLAGFVNENRPLLEAAMQEITERGQDACRVARAIIQHQLIVWAERIPSSVLPRASTLIAQVRRLNARLVPEPAQAGVMAAYLPVLAANHERTPGFEHESDYRPRPTADAHADLYLMAAFTAVHGRDPHLRGVREQVAGAAAYLSRPDRTLTTGMLTPAEYERAEGVVVAVLADQAAPLHPRYRTTGMRRLVQDHALAVAHDLAGGDGDAIHELRRLNEQLLELRAQHQQDQHRPPPSPSDPRAHAARLLAERVRRRARGGPRRKRGT